ncbi:MAG: tetratricopeptide repeat protein [Gammaproteobacteria bacterium]|nr:tetratricopeptide repeat protein [Gammaproteobacteria bacterium]
MSTIKKRQLIGVVFTTLLALYVCANDLEQELQFLPAELADDILRMKAHSDAQLATESDPSVRAEILGQLAFIYHAQQMLNSAEAAYEEALDNDEVYAYRYLLAIIVLQRGDTEDAVAHLDQVVLSNPDYVPAWYRLGNLKLLQGDVSGAETAFLNAQKIYADSAAIMVGVADVALAREDWESAIEQLEKAAVFAPNNGQIAYKLVTAYRQLGNQDKVDQWMPLANSSMQPPPLTDPLMVELAGLSRSGRFFSQAADWAFQRGDREAARDALLQATQLEPGNLEYALKYAAFLELTGAMDEAVTEIKRFLSVREDAASAWFFLARLFRDSEDGETFLQGLVAVQKAIELDSEEDIYRALAAAMSLQAALYPHAQEYYMQLVERNPSNPYFYYWFALSRLAESQCDGRDALQRAISLRRNWGEAHVALARADAFCGDLAAATQRLDALAKAAADRDIQSAQAYVALLKGDLENARLLSEPLLPDPDAQMVVDSIDANSRPDRLFADNSSWWIPPELVN